MKEHTDETVQPVEREDIVLGTTQWPRDWESFNQSYVGRHEAEKLSNDELIEYLQQAVKVRQGHDSLCRHTETACRCCGLSGGFQIMVHCRIRHLWGRCYYDGRKKEVCRTVRIV